MSDEREMKIVIRAQDEFSGVMEQASTIAGVCASSIKKSFDGAISSAELAGINSYLSALQKVREIESERDEQSRAAAEKRLADLEKQSPYTQDSGGTESIYLEYQKKLVALQAYNTAVIQEMTRAGMAQAAIDEKYTELSNDYAGKRKDFQIQAASDTAGAISNTLENLYVATGSQNRALFEAMKAFAIAETTIKTYQGAMEAYSAMAGIPIVGPALGAAAAAAVVAAGMARVAQISSTSIGGGSSISAEGTADPSYSGGSFDAYPSPTTLSSDSMPAQDITIQIYNPLSTQNWQQIVEDNIIPALNDAADRNITVTVKNM